MYLWAASREQDRKRHLGSLGEAAARLHRRAESGCGRARAIRR
jgi:hypothetical protein